MKKTLFLLLLLSLFLTASGCRRRTTTAAPIPQSVADAQPLGDDSPSRAAPQTSSPDAAPDSETVENPDSPRREYDENAAAGIDFTAHHPIQGDGEGGGQPLSGGEVRQTATQFDDKASLPVTMTLPDDDAERIGTANDAQTAETATQYYTALLSSRLGKLFECQRLSVYWETGDDHVTIGKTSKEHALLLSAGAYNAASRRAEDMLIVDDGWIERKNPDAIVKVVPDSVLGGGVFLTESAQSIRHALLTRKAAQAQSEKSASTCSPNRCCKRRRPALRQPSIWRRRCIPTCSAMSMPPKPPVNSSTKRGFRPQERSSIRNHPA